MRAFLVALGCAGYVIVGTLFLIGLMVWLNDDMPRGYDESGTGTDGSEEW